MSKNKKINVEYEGKVIEVNEGTKILDIMEDLKPKKESVIVAAKIENELRELNYRLKESCELKFLDLTDSDGYRIYRRSLSFVFIRAAKEILSGARISVEHSLSKGLYCEIHYKRPISEDDVTRIEERMKEIVDEGVDIKKDRVPLNKAKDIFKNLGMESKTKLFEFQDRTELNIYTCGWLQDYFYGYMVPNTSYLKNFQLRFYEPGVIIRYPQKENPNEIPEFTEQKKLSSIFRESEKWGEILEVAYIANLNTHIKDNTYPELIRVAEGLHEKKTVEIADMIKEQNKRIVLIAGPSSSGKTTFSKRLSIQLKVNGLRPIELSVDDYFVNREDTPLDENGEYDFEAVEAVDLKLFNEHLNKLVKGEKVEIPTFNFKTGKREYRGKFMQIDEDQIIIIEGIHGLNNKLTEAISDDKKFKIYISALTQLNIDGHNRIPTTDTRLIRRIVRDSKYRGHSAKTTLGLWKSVRRGEKRNIFPYQEEADVMFNSALFYELAVLKKYAEPLLKEITKDDKEFLEAKRLLKFLHYFLSIERDEVIPQTSILKEFVGGSCFRD
ncbi:nucleoside kinase [Anaeromicrobium sediminis]|uniref:AAA family ATPase n=1 Tax=Anaeromicrobium sediminis TaxID=1478221 RepID=A0A267MMW5_9FIRM|nr:nucleoside kinase [Anaeromicrobium sediminis]PAB60752.1 AAA family ATPase [Anaeromicrobium sediminis]